MRRIMTRLAIALSAIFLSQSIIAQDIQAISKDDWVETFQSREIDFESAMEISTSLLSSSTEKTRSGDMDAAKKLSVMGLVLSKHLSEINPERGSASWTRNRSSLDGLEEALIQAGISPEVIRQSSLNLEAVSPLSPSLAARPTTPPIPSTAPARAPTAAERQQITNAIKLRMIDPDSLKVIHIVVYPPINGMKGACATINGRNRLGGYTGNQNMNLYFEDGGWTTGSPTGALTCEDIRELHRSRAMRQ